MDFDKLSLSEFVRYILTGFNFLLFVIALPFLYLQPSMMKDLLSETSLLTVSLLSVSIGYLMDILKVYQFTPKFNAKKTQFRKEIAEILDIPQEQVSSYFSLVSKLWGKYSPYSLERRRSEWVLTLHTAVTLIVSIAVWCIVMVYEYLRAGITLRLSIPILAVIFSILCLARLFKIANREREKSNQDFVIIIKRNKAKILESWSLELYKEDDNSND